MTSENKSTKPGRAIYWSFRVPEAWYAAAVCCIQMVINITIPTFLRLLIDYAVPTKSNIAFNWFIGGTAIGVTLYSLLRSNVRYLQGVARDHFELYLMQLKNQRMVDAMVSANWKQLDRLASIPRDNFIRVADLLSVLPSQVIAGSFYLFAIVLALYLTTGPITLVIVGAVVVLKFVDLWVGSKQAVSIEHKSLTLSQVLNRENDILHSSRTVFGINPRGIFNNSWGNSIGELGKAMRSLRYKELYQYSYLFISSEILFLFSFWVAGSQSMKGEITFGQFVFVVTLLLQLAQPLSMVMDGLMELKRTWGLTKELFITLESKCDFLCEEVSNSFSSNTEHAKPPALPFRIALTGPSGCGKTTLAEGWYRQWIKNEDFKLTVSMVPQQLFLFSAPANEYFPHQEGDEGSLGLRELIIEGRKSDVLSGGERRRLMVLRAFKMNPNVLILDEPEAGLDEICRQNLFEYVKREISQRPQMGFVVISHDTRFLDLAEQTIDLSNRSIAITSKRGPYG